ncbi:pfs domain-containing protein [Colletotrichum karsti]|uniref:Pfs domain-containing protein n=1 Tax=Colletotrichum karsti TaxID=1095194 RepID=A0A9P6IHU8_9PEZI|nr:pfs domain-containing protein [Colletotrichum karsti]KAF9879385.1 pfs domain-containing protein [Colletotrichum karsti]
MDGNPNISQSVTVGDTNVAAGGTVITGINQVNLGESEATKLERCRDTLFISDPEIDREELLNLKERTEGTCEWILNDEMYQSWQKSDTSQLLWISGGPGRGKTVLSVFLSQKLETLAQARSGHLLYHFHGRQNGEYGRTSAILRTFLYQIFSLRLDLAKYAIGRMGTENRTKHTLESPATLQAILNDVLGDPTLGPVVCLSDGLDEFDGDERELQSLITFFRSLAESSSKPRRVTPNTFKLLIFSREMVHLLNCPQLDLELKVETMTSDVIRFIDARIKEHPAYKKISQKAWSKLAHNIQQRCNGTFLWAAFVLDEIRQKRTESEIRRVIKNIPAGLEDIYHGILLRIDDDDREEVARLLRWVAVTFQALTVPQLAEALYSEDEEKPADESLQRVEDLVAMSRSLARVERMQPGRDDIDHTGPNGFTALWYATMAQDEQTAKLLLDKGASVVKQSFSEGSPLSNVFVCGNLLQLLLDNEMHTDPNTSDALSYAAMRNRHQNILFLLDLGFNPNSEMTDINGVISRPLHQASVFLKEDGKDALEALLRYGADVNVAVIPNQQTPLHTAAGYNEPWMIQKLVDHGADTEARELNGFRPIDFALLLGDIAVAEVLLEATHGEAISWMIFHLRIRFWYFNPNCGKYDFNAEVVVRVCKRLMQKSPSGIDRNPLQAELLSSHLKKLLVVLNWGPFSSGQAKFAHFLMQHGGRCDSEQETTTVEKLLAPLMRGDISAAEWDQTYLHGRIAVAAMIFTVAQSRAQNGSKV